MSDERGVTVEERDCVFGIVVVGQGLTVCHEGGRQRARWTDLPTLQV